MKLIFGANLPSTVEVRGYQTWRKTENTVFVLSNISEFIETTLARVLPCFEDSKKGNVHIGKPTTEFESLVVPFELTANSQCRRPIIDGC